MQPERGEAPPSVLGALCSCAGAQSCYEFGMVLRAKANKESGVAGYVETLLEKSLEGLFKEKGERLSGLAFAAFCRGLDENPELPNGFGTKVFGNEAMRFGEKMIDGCLEEGLAQWQVEACLSAFKGANQQRQLAVVLGAMAGETLALLADATRRLEMDRDGAKVLGLAAGASLAKVAEHWPAKEEGREEATESMFKRGSSAWRAHLANVSHSADEGENAKESIGAAISCLGEPFLASLSLNCNGSMSAVIEARRFELVAKNPNVPGRANRM